MSIILTILILILCVSTCGGCDNSDYDYHEEAIREAETKAYEMTHISTDFYIYDLSFDKNGNDAFVSIRYMDRTEKEVDFIAFGAIWLDRWGEPTTDYKSYSKNSILSWNNPDKHDTAKWRNAANGEQIKGVRIPLIEIHYKDGTIKRLSEFEIGGETSTM